MKFKFKFFNIYFLIILQVLSTIAMLLITLIIKKHWDFDNTLGSVFSHKSIYAAIIITSIWATYSTLYTKHIKKLDDLNKYNAKVNDDNAQRIEEIAEENRIKKSAYKQLEKNMVEAIKNGDTIQFNRTNNFIKKLRSDI